MLLNEAYRRPFWWLGRKRAEWTSLLSVVLVVLWLLSTGCSERAVPLEGKATNQNPSPKVSQPVEANKAWFRDHTGGWNLDFVHSPGDPSDYFMPKIIGSGCAILDYDRDGMMDLYLLQGAGPDSSSKNQLYRQTSQGRFENLSQGSGLDFADFCSGVSVGDANNDGWPDILVTGYQFCRLFINLQGTQFLDVSEEAGLSNSLWGTASTFFDYDRDGFLDLFIGNYSDFPKTKECWGIDGKTEFCGPSGFPPIPSKLFRNTGVEGQTPKFIDTTLSSGIGQHTGNALGVVCLDVSGDGWPDIFVADDARPNRLFINQQNGEFQEEAMKRGIALDAMGRTRANMGVAIGDIDHDGLTDLFVTHLMTENHTLWKQGPVGMFADTTIPWKLHKTTWKGTAFGTVFADFNHDTFEDVFFVNGAIRRGQSVPSNPTPELDPFWHPYAQQDQLMMNDGGKSFVDISAQEKDINETAAVGRALAVGDLDNDGDLDLVVNSIGSSARLFENILNNSGAWLSIRVLLPEMGDRDALGAKVTVRKDAHQWTRWLSTSSSFESANDPRLHFGLGEYETVDAIEILWPDATKELFQGVQTRQFLVLRKGSGSPQN